MSLWGALGAAFMKAFSGRWLALWPFGAGAAAYGLLQTFFFKPVGLYVFGHELSHALAAFLSGCEVKSFSASPKGGEVILNRSNVWVALAPYFLPLYTLVVAGVFGLVNVYAGFRSPPAGWGFAVGFTLSFHVFLTVHALRQRQPDLKEAGTPLSLVLILLVFGLVLACVLKLFFPGWVSLRGLWAHWVSCLLLCLDRVGAAASFLAGLARERGLW